jgi:hypothetical protein
MKSRASLERPVSHSKSCDQSDLPPTSQIGQLDEANDDHESPSQIVKEKTERLISKSSDDDVEKQNKVVRYDKSDESPSRLYHQNHERLRSLENQRTFQNCQSQEQHRIIKADRQSASPNAGSPNRTLFPPVNSLHQNVNPNELSWSEESRRKGNFKVY